MKRLCIYVTYNKSYVIQDYVLHMLKALLREKIDVVLVCNFPETVSNMASIIKLNLKYYCRENKGYDAGAYKDALISYLGWDYVRKYDELILTNDSFMGPLFDFATFLQQMDGKVCDYWGITGQDAGELKNPIRKFERYISSYFLCFRHSILQSNCFEQYWENLKYPMIFREAQDFYELQLNEILREKGFKGCSYIPVDAYDLERNEIGYYVYGYEMVKDYRLPFLKKKSLLMRIKGFDNTLKVIDYLRSNSSYPAEWIEKVMDSQFITDDGNMTLAEFYLSKDDIVIYGNGVAGKNLKTYFAYKGWKYRCIAVTKRNGNEDVIEVQDLKISKNIGIIIAVIKQEVADEIKACIRRYHGDVALFSLADCGAIRDPI